MSDIVWTLEPDDIEYTYNNKSHFEKDKALAYLIMNDVVFLNSKWYKKELPENERDSINVIVNCNDIFAWACSDGEDLPYNEIPNLYELCKKYPSWGGALWCMIQRKEMPQDAVADAMRESGIDLEAFQREHNLRTNYYSGISKLIGARKYSLYKEWATNLGQEVLPYDKYWWEGWKKFAEAHPLWEELVQYGNTTEKFKKENGYE